MPKHIPQSKEMMGIHFSNELAYCYSVIDEYLRSHGQRFSSDLSYIFLETKVTYDAKGRPKGSGSGMFMLKMKPFLKYLYATPEEAIFRDEETDANYLHARFLLTNPRIASLTSTFSTMILYVFIYMERNIDLLVDDIRTGSISEEVKLSDAARASITKRIKPMPERAEEIRRAFDKVDTEPVVPKLWPRLQFVYAIGAGGFATHSEMLRRYTGTVPFYNVTLSASEGLFGVADGVEETNFLMTTNAGYFEFIPLENAFDENPPTLDISQVELNHEYETVITNLSGFYRYRMGDVVEVTGFSTRLPRWNSATGLGRSSTWPARRPTCVISSGVSNSSSSRLASKSSSMRSRPSPMCTPTTTSSIWSPSSRSTTGLCPPTRRSSRRRWRRQTPLMAQRSKRACSHLLSSSSTSPRRTSSTAR